jgi:hypothetical protein
MSFGEILFILIILAFFIGAALMGMARPWDTADPNDRPQLIDADGDVPPEEESPI